MRLLLFGLLAGAWIGSIGSALALHKPEAEVVYNHITEDGSPYDDVFKSAYQSRYRFIDVTAGPSFKRAQIIFSTWPKTPTNTRGEPVHGYILVAYIISTGGRATKPRVIKTTDPLLAGPTLRAMQEWQFQPAVLDGSPVATLAGQEFNIGPRR